MSYVVIVLICNQDDCDTATDTTILFMYDQIKSKLTKLKQTMRTKEGDRKRFRKSSEDELETMTSKLRKFESDVSSLRQIQSEIDAYLDSNKEENLNRINDKISSLSHRSDSKNKEIDKIKPELQKLSKRIEDQASQEKLIKENLKMIEMKDRISKLEAAVFDAKTEVEKVEGFDKYERALRNCQKELQEHSNKQARTEGRRGGLVDQVRSLKKKLKGEDYKNIDERHRVTVIKYETTQIAVSDLDKYYSARKSRINDVLSTLAIRFRYRLTLFLLTRASLKLTTLFFVITASRSRRSTGSFASSGT